MDTLIGSQSIIVTLDADPFLFERIEQVKDARLGVVEINSTDQELLARIIKAFPSLRVGAGNIIDTQQLEQCYQAGVHFATSPGFIPAIAQTANIYSINYLPGVATPSEAMQALGSGCTTVRPYPASLQFCTVLNKALPLLRLYPAEIKLQEAEDYLRLPSVAGVSIANPPPEVLRDVCQHAMA